ncbi:hypothetical protein NMY22_g19245 [Coprinellus aureogranulatus]|nr:hypothetical protein NMY22_g19245 [Coprinellus aureogranulatus]
MYSLRDRPLAFLLISSTSHLCSALEFTLEPWGTDRPVPGTVVFFSVSRTTGDPQFVDVLLMDNGRGNSSILFSRHDLAQYSYAGFELPAGIPPGNAYVVRMSDATTSPPQPLKDSRPFQIYAPGTPPSVATSTSTMTGTVLSVIAASPTGTSDSSSGKSKLPVGAIAGGVVGGVALIALFILLLWCIRRQDRPITQEEVERKRQKKQKKLQEKDVISPFTLTEPPPLPSPNTYPPSSAEGSSSPTSLSNSLPRRQRSNSNRQDARAEKARLAQHMRNQEPFSPRSIERLPTELTANSTLGGSGSDDVHTSSTTLVQPSPPSKSPRKKGRKKSTERVYRTQLPLSPQLSDAEMAEELRKERERLDRQIADLERRASVGGSRKSSRRRQTSEDDEMLAQLATLRERMHLLDTGRTSVPSEPPPEYYPASVAGSRR